MVEVIFDGTQKRPALSMAEVTLTFDNSQNGLPVQFSEVVITRRLFRSGESQYFLNKTQCRLRDIRELFLDTGVGGDGYAIIDQGSVEAVLTYNPEERRALFEEAAGVAKYKAKRDEALRRLERVEMDMARLNDSLALVTEQVKKLDSDARKADLYRKYKERLSAMESANLVRQIEAAQKEIVEVTAKMAPLQEVLGQIGTSLDTRGAEDSSLKLERAQGQNEVIAANEKISSIKSEIVRHEERIRSAAGQIQEIAARTEALRREKESLDLRLAAIEPEIEIAKALALNAAASFQNSEAEAQSSKSRSEELNRDKDESEAALKSLEKEIFNLTEQALAGRRRLSEVESLRVHQEAQSRSALKDLERDSAQQAQAEAELAEIRTSLALEESALESADKRRAQLEEDLIAKKRKAEAMSDEILRLHQDFAQAQARLESLKAQAELDPYWRGAQAIIGASLPGVVGTVRRLVEADEKTQAELADVMGERLYAVVCEDSKAAAEAVDWLKASGRGRARILVLSSLPAFSHERNYPQEALPLIKNLSFDARFEPAIRYLFGECYGLRGATYSDHWVYGGAEIAGQPNAASFADIEVAQSRMEALRQSLDGASAEKVHLHGELEQIESAVTEARRLAHEEAARVQAFRERAAEKEKRIALYKESVEFSRSQAALVDSEIVKSKEQAQAVEAEVSGLAQSESDVKARHTEVLRDIASIQQEAAKAAAAVGLWESRLKDAQETLAMRESACGKLAGEKESIQGTLARRQEESGQLEVKKTQAHALSEESSRSLGELQSQLQSFEASSQGIFTRLSELDAAISQKETEMRSLQKEHASVEHELHAHDLELSARKSSEQGLLRRLVEEHGIEFEAAKSAVAEEPDAEKMEFLRKRISSLGNVNLAAAEEYQSLTERQTFLGAQIQDLTKAKDDLRDAIQKINSSTRENFRETFVQVQGHFRRLFGVLFEGGSADLVLSQPENMLETGIDIVAQPPGKKLQSLSLLSGGEKALTAIALLFAFFMVKPSPFCMMDEADAALDDANVERFVNLLREFQGRTQFLIVSHNKRTMEAAEAIYGVTMEEMGVSQLISVDFRKKPETPAAASAANQDSAPNPEPQSSELSAQP
jgi:chromosome segregation protein